MNRVSVGGSGVVNIANRRPNVRKFFIIHFRVGGFRHCRIVRIRMSDTLLLTDPFRIGHVRGVFDRLDFVVFGSH